MEWEIRLVRRATETPVIIDAGEHATVAQLRRAVAAQLAVPADAAVLTLAGRLLSDELSIAAAGLVAGAAVAVGHPPVLPAAPVHPPVRRPPARADEHLELAVVGGRGAGDALPVPVGATVTVGRDTGCELVVPDPEVSRRHARVSVVDSGAGALTDLGSRNGTGVRGYRIDGATRLAEHDVCQLGETVLGLRRYRSAPARLETGGGPGVLQFNRPPRIARPAARPEVSVPGRPRPARGFRFPVLAVLLPLLAAGALYLLWPGSGYFLIFLVLSPLMIVANVISDRRSGRAEYKAALREYEQGLTAARARLNELAIEQERSSRSELPDPAAVVRIGTGPTSRLFERRPGDPDFLRMRVGLADRPTDVALTGPGAGDEQPPTAHAVPVTVDLAEVGVLGVAGPRDATLPLARALLAQAGTLHAPHDLGIVLLTGTDEVPDWEWVGWLPHTLPHTAEMTSRRMVASNLEQAETRIAELAKLVSRRRDEQRAVLRDGAPLGRRLVVVADGARRLRGLAGLAGLLADGPRVGVYALCLDTTESSLPDECRATVVAAASSTRFRVSRPGSPPLDDVLAEGLTAPLTCGLATALAPIRVLGARLGDDGDLPETVRFLDHVGLGPDPEPDDILAGWRAHPGGRCTRVRIGVGPNGPVELDLRRDGPHGLVAGTSGAGKSELLQALVADLALGNAPDALNVMLVDYKGGSAFAECAELPHCVGMITDLDGHLVSRALSSLSAELRRREELLAAAGAKDIEDYWASTGARLPRLVIVIDEFASLVEEVPEFVTGVVGIGMRGRSLGVHVVLATQRPGGVVNAELRANVNLRLCLRVTSGAESSDVIDVPDAARISRHHPGRAYLRTGHSDLAMLQCARIGWPRHEPAAAIPDTVTVAPRSLGALGVAPIGRGRGGQHPSEPPDGQQGPTDLTVLVAAVRSAAGQVGVTAPPGPWLPPLPSQVSAAQLDTVLPGSPVAVAAGLADHPTRQAQPPFVLDLDETGPVVVAGMARSGRSTVLRTLAAGLAARTSPADVHLYALDYGSRALAPLTGLPHCGAWVDSDDTDRAQRLLALLTAELGRRQRLLAAGGFGSMAEQRASAAPADRLPYLVLLVDQYETFLARHQETDGGQLVDTLDGVLRRGAAAGIVAVLSTDRTGFTHRLSTVAATRIVLRQAHSDDMSVYGLTPRHAPGSMPPGRAVVLPSGVEVQVALLGPDPGSGAITDPDGTGQTAAIERLGAVLRHRWEGLGDARLPHRIDPLPATVSVEELARLRVGDPPRGWASCTVGAGGDHLAPVDVDLADAGGTFLVCGPQGSGRSTALLAMAGSLAGLADGTLPVIAVCPRPSPLRGIAGTAGVAAVLTAGIDLRGELDDALAAVGDPVAVLVDDAELLADDPAAVLERLVRDARDRGCLVIAAGTTEDLLVARYRGWLAAARRSRSGLLLNPASYLDGEVFDLKLPRSINGGWPPGRGLLVRRGHTLRIQVPTATWCPSRAEY
ncbi:MAG: FtsK/SpoIIIE domain-containing protein [Pseudonocardiaceae bacterium]